MKHRRAPEPEIPVPPVKSITKVLEKSEQVEEMVKESAEELASVNTVLKTEMKGRAGVAGALEKNAAIEHKVEQATEQLAEVNVALADEIRDRNLLDHQLAAVTEQEEAARFASLHDVLTGLPNRALFDDRLKHGIAQATRHGWSLAVMFLDLDRFKEINDTHGHDAGDAVLKEVSRRMEGSTRDDDTISRLGGDEFLYLLMEVRDVATVALIAKKLIDSIAAPMDVRVRELRLSVCVKPSIGIAVFPKDGATAKALVMSADQAMYRAKKNDSGFSFAA